MPTRSYFLVLFFLSGCASRESRIAEWQSAMLAALGEREYFRFEFQGQEYKWPLPPDPSKADASIQQLMQLRRQVEEYVSAHPDAAANQEIAEMQKSLDAIAGKGDRPALFNPEKCVLTCLGDDNKVMQGQISLDLALTKIPEYYEEVERRWQRVDPEHARKAARQSLKVLDQLEMQGASAREARYAIKDFIGLCLSAAAN